MNSLEILSNKIILIILDTIFKAKTGHIVWWFIFLEIKKKKKSFYYEKIHNKFWERYIRYL